MFVFDRIKSFAGSISDSSSSRKGIPGSTAWLSVHTIEMHTGGEPLRVIVAGYPELPGTNVLERRRFARQNLDHLRTALMLEPRGHADMYGCLLVPPNDNDADFGIIFLHNEGYSTMCGHAIIAISRLVYQMRWKEPVEGDENVLQIDAPCGRITSLTTIENGSVGKVRFQCVPSFVVGLDRKANVPGIGQVMYDLAFGGAFYACVDLRKNDLGFQLCASDNRAIIHAGKSIKQAVIQQDSEIAHPTEDELSFLYGTIFIDDAEDPVLHSRNVCVFADGEVDRCPTGSGVSGRMAIHYARREVNIGQEIEIESILGTRFTGSVLREATSGSLPAVIPQVQGEAFIVGQNHFLIDPADPLRYGFMLR